MAELVEYELRVGRGSMDDWEAFLERLGECRAAIAAVVGAEVDEIAMTHSASGALNAAMSSVDLRPGDRIVTTHAEHPGGLGAVHAAAARSGAEISVVNLPPTGEARDIVSAFDTALGDRARVVALSHVLWTTGAVLPVAEIAELAHARGAVVVVDGAQAAGAIPLNVHDLGADFYAISGQKWLLGPEGTGALWASPAVTGQSLVPVGSVLSYERIDERAAVPWPNARRFEEPGHYRPGITGLARSCGWLSMYVGLPWIHARGMSMARAALRRLAAIEAVEMLTPVDAMATLVTFRIGVGTPPLRSPRSPAGRSRSPARSRRSTRSGSASGSSRRSTRSSGSPPRSSSWRRTPPRRCRSARDSRSSAPHDGANQLATDSPQVLAGDPLATVPARAAARRPGRPQQPGRGDRPRARLPDLRHRDPPRRGAARWRPSHAVPVALDVAVVLVVGSVVTWLVVPAAARFGRARDPLCVERRARVLRGRPDLLPRPRRRRSRSSSRCSAERRLRSPMGPNAGAAGKRPREVPAGTTSVLATVARGWPIRTIPRYCRIDNHPLRRATRLAGEDDHVAMDEQPHIALPKLYGAPAYARPAPIVEESPRPFDPDDLPIEAIQTDEERELARNPPGTVLRTRGNAAATRASSQGRALASPSAAEPQGARGPHPGPERQLVQPPRRSAECQASGRSSRRSSPTGGRIRAGE